MILIFILSTLINGQPCVAPIATVTTTVTGVSPGPVASTAGTQFAAAALGGMASNNGVLQYSLSLWLQPPSPVAGSPVQSVFRLSMNNADTTPSTTDGVRLALFMQYDSTDLTKQGLQLGWAETPSTYLFISDITLFLMPFSTNTWMFIYAGVDTAAGNIKLFAWQVDKTQYSVYTFTASKTNFNNALDGTNLYLNVLYWGTYQYYQGSVAKVNWMPSYYENTDDNCLKLAYMLSGQSNTQISLIRFDYSVTAGNVKDDAATTVAITNTDITPPTTYYVLNTANQFVTVMTAAWTYTDKSYTFSIHVNFQSLPVFGNDIVLLQKATAAGVNKLSVRVAQQPDGTQGILLMISTIDTLLYKFALLAQNWYFIQVSVAFAGALTGQTVTIAHYHVVGPDGSYTYHGYQIIPYSTSFSAAAAVATDKTYVGAPSNLYSGDLWVRQFSLATGFSVFSGSVTFPNLCITNCIIGVTSLTAANNKCLICAAAQSLDYDFTCPTAYVCTTSTTPGYYSVLESSFSTCVACCKPTATPDPYYVSSIGTCIAAQAGNGFMEPGEQCDDNNLVAGDGCTCVAAGTCTLNAGWNCSVVMYQLSVCTKLCGNGIYNKVTAPAALVYDEVCDDGNTIDNDGCHGDCQSIETALWSCGTFYPTVCTLLCGNSQLNNVVGLGQTETCDDGNTTSGDGCSASCTIEAGYACSSVALQLSSCIKLCGNGVVEASNSEICDDGNQVPSDGCTNCLIDPGYTCVGTLCYLLCGDAIIEVSNGEACDDGNTIAYDGCSNCQVDPGWTCTPLGVNPTTCKLCGNSKREIGEQCDDGNTVSGDGCSATCQLEAGWTCNGASPDLCNNCGDGKKQQLEQCDDNNNIANDGCTNCIIDTYWSCSGGSPTTADVCVRMCPNGIVNIGEQCDTGTNVAGTGCFNCIVQSNFVCIGQPSVCSADVCGNGMSNSATEQCDDGNIVSGDGCSSTCQIETGWQCTGTSYNSKSICSNICGDGKRVTIEQCDDANLIDGDGCSHSCQVELAYTCTGGTSTSQDVCKVTCGNNVIDSNEQCDDGNRRNGDGCNNLCLIESGWGCALQTIHNTVFDQCFQCVANCAVCSDNTVSGCSLCFMGYYLNSTQCTNNCGIGYYADYPTQTCISCGTGCNQCYSPTSCYNCGKNQVLSGNQCVVACPDGYFQKSDSIHGAWCKLCPTNCLTCSSESKCLTCANYYSVNGVCQACNLGSLCLQCDFSSGYCVSCQLGYRPIGQQCVLIQASCGDGLKASSEECDDGNLVDNDGCSAACKIETGANCKLKQNQGPSICFSTIGWGFTLQSFILEPTIILIKFDQPIMYNKFQLLNYTQVFTITINGFTSADFKYSFVNISSNNSLNIQFTFLSNVISQSATIACVNQTLLTNQYGVQINNQSLTQTVNLQDVEFYSEDQQNMFTIFNKVTLTLEVLNWILVIGAAFLGQKYRIWKTIEVVQVIAVLYYVNIRSFPLNNNQIFETLRLSNMYLLPDPLSQNTSDLVGLTRFQYAGLTHQVLNNAGGRFLLSIIISIATYVAIKIIYSKLVLFVFEIFLEKLEFSYFFKLYEVFLLDLLISCFHNINYQSMANNWDGTNTVVALILMLFIIIIQVILGLLLQFKEKFGTEDEVELMLGSLSEGLKHNQWFHRIFISQMEFVKRFFIAFAIIFVSDAFNQLLFIAIPRVIISIITTLLMQNKYLRIKEVVSEALLLGIFAIVYLLSTGNFVGDLQTKVFYGWLLEYQAIGLMGLHFMINTYLVWRLLYNLETDMPQAIDPNAGLKKEVDLFRLKDKDTGKKKPLPQILQEDMDAKVRQDELDAKRRKAQQDALNNKNKDREKWNVWDMDREAEPEQRKFVSINHNNNEIDNLEFQNPNQNHDDIIRFDELEDIDQVFGQPQGYNPPQPSSHIAPPQQEHEEEESEQKSQGIYEEPW